MQEGSCEINSGVVDTVHTDPRQNISLLLSESRLILILIEGINLILYVYNYILMMIGLVFFYIHLTNLKLSRN